VCCIYPNTRRAYINIGVSYVIRIRAVTLYVDRACPAPSEPTIDESKTLGRACIKLYPICEVTVRNRSVSVFNREGQENVDLSRLYRNYYRNIKFTYANVFQTVYSNRSVRVAVI